MKLLIADDSSAIRERIKKLLKSFKKIDKIIESSSKDETLDYVKMYSPDVLILDIMFQDGTGIDLLHNITTIKKAPFIIILTNYDSPYYKEQCLKLGANFYLDKSKEFQKLKYLFNDLTK
jgi:DNA-binding NarL/FixJ family response regulator